MQRAEMWPSRIGCSPRRLVLAASVVAAGLAAGLAAGCGSRPTASAPGPGQPPGPAIPESARPYPAARWLPARPSYAVLALTVRDAQRAAHQLIAGAGALLGMDLPAVSSLLRSLLVVDPLSEASLADIGVDPGGGFALFSEGVNPTLVLRLAEPARLETFLAEQRAKGMAPRSVEVDGVALFTVELPNSGGARIQWAAADGWLWIHAALPHVPDDGTAWLAASRRPGAAAWAPDWARAMQQGEALSAGPTSSGGPPAPRRPQIAGFFDLRAAIAGLSPRLGAADACVRLLDPIGRAAVALELDGRQVGGRLAIDLGPTAADLQRASLPLSAWWTAPAAVPLRAQWNLDLAAVRSHLTPCATALGLPADLIATAGVRTARVALFQYDPGKPTNSRGAVSLDLSSKAYFAKLLDEIPGRSLIQRRRTFGPYQGYSLSIPFGGPTIEYVLDDQRALAGLGEGVLATVVGQGAGSDGPLFAIELEPPRMSREAWAGLLGMLHLSPSALLAFQSLHLSARVEGADLVLQVGAAPR